MSLNVMIVDDSAVMRAMIARVLHLSGLPFRKVHEASNGRDALDMLDGQRIDLGLEAGCVGLRLFLVSGCTSGEPSL